MLSPLMNLKVIFERIKSQNLIPDKGVLLTELISNSKGIRFGIDSNGNPLILFPDLFHKEGRYKHYRLKNIEVKYSQECAFLDGSNDDKGFFTYIKLINANDHLLNYFLVLMESLICRVESNYNSKIILDSINDIIELFSKEKIIAQDIILGLWGELFYILSSEDIDRSIKAWHKEPNFPFDFVYDGRSCFEVKTTLRNKRVHEFSITQLKDYYKFSVTIGSIITEKSDLGMSLQNLWELLLKRIQNSDNKIKLTELISKTLKTDMSALTDYKFNIELAQDSLKFYDSKQLSFPNLPIHRSIEQIRLTINLDELDS